MIMCSYLGKRAFIAGVVDDNGYGWAITKALAAAGAEILVGNGRAVTKDFGRIDILVHSLANGPEVTKPLLETSRRGYLATISASSYSFISLLQHFLPIMNPGFFRFHESKTIAYFISHLHFVLDVSVKHGKRCFNIFDIHSFRKGNPRIRRWNELSKSCIGERYKSKFNSSVIVVLAFELHLLATKHQMFHLIPTPQGALCTQ
ncbi:hypothetical protein ZIOFF_073115 [Zingiber officinale]|uniref:Enoyl-ACP reductase n=1 Tax=Zingiber officinale TaxID=94328 RepID=A0A8J5C6M3_ZINOF|nr:hypothetical protein ZIOFF_073115 [Zingiber officinale]